jgi:hypothetical protein
MRLAVVFAIASENSGSERMLRHPLQTREARGRDDGFGWRRRRISCRRSSSSSGVFGAGAGAGEEQWLLLV